MNSKSDPPGDAAAGITMRTLLLGKRVWVVPLAIGAIFITLVSTIYIGSVINPTGHLHGLPVMVVDEDTGGSAGPQSVDIGASVVAALQKSPAVGSRLKLRVVTLASAHEEMDSGHAYATLVIPRTFTRSLLQAAGVKGQGSGAPAQAGITLQENQRLGSLGVNLALGVIKPAVESVSSEVGKQLAPLESPATRTSPVLAGDVARPVALETVSYRPLPDHSALGLSAFYIALLSILSGFIAGTLTNSSIDSALGYASSELGPRWTHRRPVAITRRRTFAVKWATAALVAPVLVAILLLIAVGALGMYAPHVVLLWLLCTLAAVMVATGALALLAAFGSIGQLLAMLLLIYLSLASSGGTVPPQALPGVFNVVGHVEPLRQVLGGTRAILYFGARGDAGLTHSLILIVCEFAFWGAVGLAVTSWYDRRKLARISPEALAAVDRAIDRSATESGRSVGDRPGDVAGGSA